jgi:hypothetical protein
MRHAIFSLYRNWEIKLHTRNNIPLNITTQAISSNQGTYPIVMSPQSTTVAMVTNHDRQLNLPGSTGFQVTVLSENGGNIPNIADIYYRKVNGKEMMSWSDELSLYQIYILH